MKKVMVFGKPGGGKSTLSKHLANKLALPLHQIDSMAFKANGMAVERSHFDDAHERLLCSDRWIIDGLGPLSAFNQRLTLADTLIYIDLPYRTSYWLVTKRLIKSVYQKPEGWPEGSSVLKGTIQSYQFLSRSRAFWNDAFLQSLEQKGRGKTLYHIKSLSEISELVHTRTQ
ncbi:adenylate kinase [Pseudoalteromonas luteoviolacea]|uniref:Adenylate kinase n=1 Tax=Pseudoalteromonas luteoviolacea TaxID=43657 RepID=A0A1C0TU13_9GAMM|nr:adenylate kinase [Pseudoalteromonas luteoviolacea]MBQ4811349.1 adenylate kinase [Pseudoalteromonas luteoviolacea]OCQ22807.1 adenylate kinase [Pseudoalteromonas luteoviolacea]